MASNAPRGGLVLSQFQQIQLKLDRTNYAFWRVLVQQAIRAHGFDDFISPTAVSPSPLLPSGSGGDTVPNPGFVNWIRRDQYLFSWMLSSVGESMLGHVVRCRSSRELWSVLENVFRSQSKVQMMRYRQQLQSTKKGNLSVEDYFMKMCGIDDQLAAIGKPLDDDELLMHIMEGFGPEYESLVVNTMQRNDAHDLQEIQLAFQAYEIRLAQQHSALIENFTNVAYQGHPQSFPLGFGAGYGVGRGSGPPAGGEIG